jgi:hypothetical protein
MRRHVCCWSIIEASADTLDLKEEAKALPEE